MGKHEKRVYLEAIRKRYRRARRTDKSEILDEFVQCAVISASTPFGCWEANLPGHPGVPDGLHNTTTPHWLR